MRIAEVVNSLAVGGAERLLVDICIELKKRGHSVQVVCMRESGPLAIPLKEAGVPVAVLAKPDGMSATATVQVAKILRRQGIQIVHTHNPLVHHYGVAGGRLARVLGIVNTLHGFGNLDDSKKTRWVYEMSCLQSHRVACVCQALEAHVHKVTRIARRQTTVIRNGIALERFIHIRRRPRTDDVVFGAVGRLVPVKDHETLLKAFGLLLRRNPTSRLRILGDGPLRDYLQEVAAALGIADRVEIRPTTLAVEEFLASLDVFVLSSISEGMPLTVVEAMAAGVPVVATHVGGVPELVQGADCGWLAAPRDPVDLSSQMKLALDCSSREECGARGRRYAVELHSLGKMVDSYEGLFESLL